MTRERAKELLPIIQAYAEGKPVECKNSRGAWEPLEDAWFNREPEAYRIRPIPREFWVSMLDDDGVPLTAYNKTELEQRAKEISPALKFIHVREVIE